MPLTEPLQVCTSARCTELVMGSRSAGDGPGPTQSSQTQPVARQDYRQSQFFAERMRAARGGTQVAGTELNTAALRQYEAEMREGAGFGPRGGDHGAPPVPHLFAAFQFRLSNNPKKIDDLYGRVERAYPETKTLTDLQALALKDFNSTHTKDGRTAVDLSETLLRLKGNALIPEDHMSYSLRKWQDYALEHKLLIVNEFELFIIEPLYYNRLEQAGVSTQSVFGPLPSQIASSRRRARAPTTSQLYPAGAPSNLLRSEFALPARSSRRSSGIVTRTKAQFQKINCVKVTRSGDPIFSKESKLLEGYLSDTPLALGTMKAVFEVILNGVDDRFVLKRFFKLQKDAESGDSIYGDDRSQGEKLKVTFAVNHHNHQIHNELTRLKRGARFLRKFYEFTAEKGVTVYEGFRFADAFLLQEDGKKPTPASGFAKDNKPIQFHDDAVDSDSGLTWLAEPHLSNEHVDKYSGTLTFPTNHSEIKFLTAYAFTHWAYGHSNEKMVFADLQGSPDTIEDEFGDAVPGVILFDPMTHTLTGKSGVGDHKKKGIRAFLQQHQCRSICEQLGLNTDVPLTIHPDLEKDDDSEDEKDSSNEE
ncbi:kinase-like domain-containing protein [Ephemerocybe angulata]|uniref:Kinase-like domain-containing protein n=1 Tax=Ephemerocybe angulata TaxID=980116 RepID=A0A8H6HBE4_9AGAR|nr:kinase-like domain-containing protein [Tulosesus angulatus]